MFTSLARKMRPYDIEFWRWKKKKLFSTISVLLFLFNPLISYVNYCD
jgi:hypothetical protein